MFASLRTRRDFALAIVIQTAASLAIAIPTTLAITWLHYAGDLSRIESGWTVLRFAVALTVVQCVTVCPFVAYRGTQMLRMLNNLRDRLHSLASRDPLTGLLNRRGFDEAAAALARGGPVAVIVCDLDHFKRVNDRYGHEAGDKVLQATAEQLATVAQAQPASLLARFGGEEFVLAVAGVGAEAARLFAETARARLAARRPTGPDAAVAVTASFGVAATAEFDGDIAALIARADALLYGAKSAGRNRVETELDAPNAVAA